MHACTGKMGTITSVVAELREAPGKAENFKWKEFKAYHGGVLVVRSTRLHKVITRCTQLRACAVPRLTRGPGVRLRALGGPYETLQSAG